MSLLVLPKVTDKTNISLSINKWKIAKEDAQAIYLIPTDGVTGIIIKVERATDGERALTMNPHTPAGRFIEQQREKLGLSQHQLAAKSGVSQMSISNVENGSCDKVSSTTLDKLLLALGVDNNLFYSKHFQI